MRVEIQRAIDQQSEHFNMPGLELGYVYRNGCAVDASAAQTPENPVLDYLPSALPGARFPHMALGDETSTLNLLSYQSYTLLTHGAITNQVSHETFGLPIKETNVQNQQLLNSKSTLASALNIPSGGWILVRPDGHIAARSS
jgi:hypothetical protein